MWTIRKSTLCFVNTVVKLHNYMCIVKDWIKERCIIITRIIIKIACKKSVRIFFTLWLLWYVFTCIPRISGYYIIIYFMSETLLATVFYCMKVPVRTSLAWMSNTVKLHVKAYITLRRFRWRWEGSQLTALESFSFKTLSIPTSIYWYCTDFEGFDMFRDGAIQKRNKVTLCPIPLRKSCQ